MTLRPGRDAICIQYFSNYSVTESGFRVQEECDDVDKSRPADDGSVVEASCNRAGGMQVKGRSASVEPAVWLSLGLLVVFVDGLAASGDKWISITGVSTLSILLGLRSFIAHGGNRITAAGVLGFSFACFVGFPGLNLLFSEPVVSVSMVWLEHALVVCYFSQVGIWSFFSARHFLDSYTRSPDASASVLRLLLLIGLTLLSLAALGTTLGVEVADGSGMISQLGFIGVLFVGIWSLRAPQGIAFPRLLLLGIAFIVYMEYVFSGYGRIIVAALAFCLLISLSHQVDTVWLKLSVILATAPAVLFLMQFRLKAVAELHPGVDTNESGLESMLSPLPSFAKLLQVASSGVMEEGLGRTFLVALVVLIPRSVWPSKPAGFGTELAYYISPDAYNTGHSDAALIAGEFFFNFGYLGIVLMIPAVGLLVVWFDRMLYRAASQPIDNIYGGLKYASLLVSCCGLIDLVWVGLFSYTARAWVRLLIIVLVAGLIAIIGVRNRVGSASAVSIGRARQE